MQNNKKKPALGSILISPVSIVIWFCGCVALAYFGKAAMSIFFGFCFILMTCSYSWGRMALKNLEYSVRTSAPGIFLGQKISVTRTINNNKILPLVWLELIEYFKPDTPVMPDERFFWTKQVISGEETLVECGALYTFTLLKWHQTLTFIDEWSAVRRGIHSFDQITFRSGDGFGLSVQTKQAAQPSGARIAVYPRLIPVNIDMILRDIWDAHSSSYGYLEDTTLLRSVRDYLPSDQARRINQRLLARGMGLKVNQYETVTPSEVMFILDTASFSLSGSEEFEEALSILASLIYSLYRRGVRAGLLAPRSGYFPETMVTPTQGEKSLSGSLELLAAAQIGDPPLETRAAPAMTDMIGQAYYICGGIAEITSLNAIAPYPPNKVKILTPNGSSGEYADCRVVPIKKYRRIS